MIGTATFDINNLKIITKKKVIEIFRINKNDPKLKMHNKKRKRKEIYEYVYIYMNINIHHK